MRQFANRICAALCFLLVCLSPELATAEAPSPERHFIAFHINENDPGLFSAALTNIENIARHYEQTGEAVTFEVVAYGPGLSMLIAGESPVEDRIDYLSLALEDITFTACGNTLDARERASGHRPQLIEDVSVAQAGIVRLTELQEQGYAYIKP